jgi:pimeloyl-ACP methyl ester carboxylesterase
MVRQTGFGNQLSGLYVSISKTVIAAAFCACIAIATLHFINGSVGLLIAIAAGGLGYIFALKILNVIPREDAEVMLSIAGKMPSSLRETAKKAVTFIAPLFSEKEAVAPTGEPSADLADGAGRDAALPFAFEGTIGLFKPESPDVQKRSTAVLFVNPWGFEEMCSRKFFRVAAEHFADVGVPSLRFDYLGTGDALDLGDAPATLAVWENSIGDAVEKLKNLSGCSRVVLVAQGLGATLVQRAGIAIEGVDSIVMLGPVFSGRAYLRELSAWSKFINLHLGLGADNLPKGQQAIAGLVMPDGIAAELTKLNITTPERIAAPRYLILERPVRSHDTTFADGLRALGADVEQRTFEGYDELVIDPLFAKTPMATVHYLAGWLEANSSVDASGVPSVIAIEPQLIVGDGFEDVPVRFGEFNHLVGVISRPPGTPTGNAVLFLSTAYDRHSGWGRTIVDMARDLARQGVVSLRFDSANVGDSPPRLDAPAQILYSPTQSEDVRSATDLLEGLGTGPLMVAGRCSGGYLAIRAAVSDERLKAAVSINPFVYYWDPNQAVEKKHVVSVPRSFEDYGQRIASMDTFKRLLRGEVDVKAAVRNVAIAFARRMSVRIAPLLEYLPSRRRTAVEVKKSFLAVGKRKVPLTLIYSEGDVGLEHMYFHFGPGGRKFTRYPNVRLVMLPEADHNLTPPQSRKTVLAEIVRLAKA